MPKRTIYLTSAQEEAMSRAAERRTLSFSALLRLVLADFLSKENTPQEVHHAGRDPGTGSRLDHGV